MPAVCEGVALNHDLTMVAPHAPSRPRVLRRHLRCQRTGPDQQAGLPQQRRYNLGPGVPLPELRLTAPHKELRLRASILCWHARLRDFRYSVALPLNQGDAARWSYRLSARQGNQILEHIPELDRYFGNVAMAGHEFHNNLVIHPFEPGTASTIRSPRLLQSMPSRVLRPDIDRYPHTPPRYRARHPAKHGISPVPITPQQHVRQMRTAVTRTALDYWFGRRAPQ